MPDGSESWTVVRDDGVPVAPVERFLAHLHALDRAPTTQRTYATSLKLWLVFLDRLGIALDEVSVEHISRFVAWLRAPGENVAVQLRDTPASRASSLLAAERATVDSLRQQLRAYRSEIARLRLENQALREQLARHLGTQRAAVNTSPR